MKMNNRPMVSIIMPVYNAHKYVGKTIESILNQTYHDFELIIVDDGATDGSGKICDDYAKQDLRIVMIHQKNGGICNARNVGLNMARGKYIAFCDHDDLYQNSYLELAIREAEKTKADLVKFSYQSQYSRDNIVIRSFQEKVPHKEYLVEELIKNHYELLNKVVRVLWNGLYKKSVIDDENIRFDENIRAGMEDFVFNLQLLKKISKVVFMPEVLFFHYARLEQSTSEKYSENRLKDIITALKIESEWLGKYHVSAKIIVQHRSKYVALMSRTLCHEECSLSWKERKEWLRRLKEADNLSSDGVLIEAIKECRNSPHIALQDVLFALNCNFLVLYIWKIHTERKNARKK